MNLTAVDRIVDSYDGEKSSLVMILQDVQEACNHLPAPALERVSQRMSVPMSHVYRVATFYSSFSLTERGRHVIRVCDGTACHLRGSVNLRDEICRELNITVGETTEDKLFTLETVACLGACALAPVMTVGSEYQGQMTVEKVRETLDAYRNAPRGKVADRSSTPRRQGRRAGQGEITRLTGPDQLASYRQRLAAGGGGNGRCVMICGGTGCRAGRSLAVTEAFRDALKGSPGGEELEVRTTGCHGFCEQGPLVVLLPAGTLYVKVAPEDVQEIVATSLEADGVVDRLTCRDPATKKRIRREHDLPFYANQGRIVFANSGRLDPTNIDDYIAVGGYASLAKVLTSMQPEQVIDCIDRSGLRGRGGGGFAAGRKWRSCREAEGYPKYVLCNGDEGDPGAFMDRSIMEGNPHSVLEGMAIGAYAIGSDRGYIYVRLEYPLAVENLRIAIRQAEQRALLGENILGTDFSFTIKVSRGAGAFVCGESTALMASIEGQAGEPRAKHIHTSEKGLFGKPTNLNNVETWANVPVIIHEGPEWFAAIGTENSKGTKVFSVVGKVKSTGLVEVPMGMTLRQIIYDIGGGVLGDRPFKAVQTGGPSGGCLPESQLDLPVDFDRLTEAGSMMGSGGMIVMDDRTCMVEVARYFTDFLRKESCGKCLACREGVQRMYELLERITSGQGTIEDVELLDELSRYVGENSICGLGKSAPNPALSTLKYFRDEYAAHVVEHKCPAGVCKALTTFTIDEEKCKACGQCLKACPTEAITGQKKVPHVIDQDKCDKCGSCREVCPFDAVATV